MGIDHNYIPPLEPNHEKKAKIMPAAGIYRPPAARRLGSQDAVAVNSPGEKKTKSRQRRPDIQVYVPRAKRASAGGSTDVPPTSPTVPTTALPVRRHSLNSATQSQHKKSLKLSVECSRQSNTDQQDCTIPSTLDLDEKSNANCSRVAKVTHSSTVIGDSNDICLVSNHNLGLDNDKDIITEGNSREQLSKCNSSMRNQQNMDLESGSVLTTASLLLDDNSVTRDVHKNDKSFGLLSIVSSTRFDMSDQFSYLVQPLERDESLNNSDNQISNIETNISCVDSHETVCKLLSMTEETHDNIESKNSNNVSDDPNYFITIGCETRVENHVKNRVDDTCLVDILPKDERIPKLDDEDSRCINREEQNRKNRSIHRGNINFISDLLVISDTESSLDSSLPHQDLNNSQQANESVPNQKLYKPKSDGENLENICEDPSTLSALRLNPDECTWDMMFDESGDCLDPLLMDELTSKVGSVTIKTPRSDYKAYATREFQPRDEYSHVVEIYNFPSAFKTKDLFTIFAPFSSGGFEIKWVDDTHCLGVFSSSVVAAEVLETNHPFCKIRPLCEATSESKAKARRSSEFLQPYRARPETCPALARRLVTGALGVRLSTARQEREAEKALLKVARDKKKLEARQKDEAWEGTFVGTPSTSD